MKWKIAKKVWTRGILLGCAILLLWSGTLYGGPLWNWGKTFGGLWYEDVFSLQATRDGGFILAGRTDTFVTNPGYEDAWILKLKGQGQVQWEKTYGGELWDRFDSIRQTRDGGYIAAGKRVAPGGSQDAWVMKLTPDGQVSWDQTYGREQFYDGARAIQQTADGGFIVLGWTMSYALGAEQGGWVFKLSQEGDIQWQKFFGGDRYDDLFSIEQTADDGFILAGGTFSFTEDPRLYSDVWVIKLSRDGNVEWQKTYGGQGDDVAYAIRQTYDGGYLLACWTSSFHQGWGDIWVVKLDPQGSMIWQKSFGGKWGDVPFDLQVTTDGGSIIAGYSASFGAGHNDAWVLKLAPNGRVKWQKTFGGPEADTFHTIQETRWGYVAAGTTQSFGAGEKDAWVVGFSRQGLLLGSSIDADSAAQPADTNASWGPVDGYYGNTEGVSFPSEVTVTDTFSGQDTLTQFPTRPAFLYRQDDTDSLNLCVRWPRSAAAPGGQKCLVDSFGLPPASSR